MTPNCGCGIALAREDLFCKDCIRSAGPLFGPPLARSWLVRNRSCCRATRRSKRLSSACTRDGCRRGRSGAAAASRGGHALLRKRAQGVRTARSGALVRAIGAHFNRMGKQVVFERATGVGLHRYDVSQPACLPAEGLDIAVSVASPRSCRSRASSSGLGRTAGSCAARDLEDVGHRGA